MTQQDNFGHEAATEKFDTVAGTIPRAKIKVEFNLPPGQYLNTHQLQTMTATLQKQIIDMKTAPQLEEKVIRFMKNGWLKFHVITQHKSGKFLMSTHPAPRRGPQQVELPDDYNWDDAGNHSVEIKNAATKMAEKTDDSEN